MKTLAAALALLALGAPADPKGVTVKILAPSPTAPCFGRVEVVAEVTGQDQVSTVEVIVDGRALGRLTAPPYRFEVDVGQENRAHTFRVFAKTKDGQTVAAVRETPAIKVNYEMELVLREVYVTVEKNGERVPGLPREDFRILDDGKPQEIVTFEGGDAPITAVLLVDSSESMKGEGLSAALAGAQSFAQGMKDLDEAAVFLFSDRLLRATPFTGSAVELARSLEGASADGGTALTDHLYAGLKLLDGRQGRRVVVVLSDGLDVHSALSMKDVLWKARRSQALVYWIRLKEGELAEGLSYSSAWRDAPSNRIEIDSLTHAVEQSGGRILSIDAVADSEKAFRTILAELREQYVLGYYPNKVANDGSWHEIEIDVRGFGLDIRARDGYVDF